MPIDEEDELERLGAMMQRDNLIRSLGVVEQVYRLLHGSCAVSKSNDKSIIKVLENMFLTRGNEICEQ